MVGGTFWCSQAVYHQFDWLYYFFGFMRIIDQSRNAGDVPYWTGAIWWANYAAQPDFADAYFPSRKTISSHGHVGNDHCRRTDSGPYFRRFNQ
ncbi:hypothetical protein D3C71_1563770 [compost metagenome]